MNESEESDPDKQAALGWNAQVVIGLAFGLGIAAVALFAGSWWPSAALWPWIVVFIVAWILVYLLLRAKLIGILLGITIGTAGGYAFMWYFIRAPGFG